MLLSYQQDLSDNFSLGLNAGANLRQSKFEDLQVAGANFIVENLFAINNTTQPIINENFQDKEQQSVYAFGEIGFKNAIFLSWLLPQRLDLHLTRRQPFVQLPFSGSDGGG